ncbi:MAG: EamA family transporter [Saprospiraceae bacterium]|nr:EamA family transporter [Saprospiraceae bacterium]
MENRAFVAVLIGASIAGLSGLLIKQMTIPATSIAFIRTALPSICIGAWMASTGIRFFRGNYQKMLLASFLNAARMYLFLLAYLYTSISNAVIILFTWPIFVNIMSSFWLKERISKKQIFLLLIAFLGIVVIYSDQDLSFADQDFAGMTAGLGAALLYSFSYIIFKTEIQNYTRNEVIFYQNLVGGFVFLPFFLFNRPFPDLGNWTYATTYALVMGVLIFNFFFYGLKYLNASKASVLGYFEIVTAILSGVLILHEELSYNMILGGTMILVSLSMLRRA